MDAPPVGSLVVPSPKYRENMGTGDGAAVLLALCRGSGKLFYAAPDCTYWVPMNEVRGIPSEAVPEDTLERLLTDLLTFLDAEECEIETYEGGAMTLAVEAPFLTRLQLRQLEWRFRGRLESVDFGPRNMSRIMLHVHLVFLPAAAATGT